MTFQTQFLTN